MNDVLKDEAARARALDPRTSFIVTAPAGSGKTELLVWRLLVLLATAEHPEEIVAITFTRKAAAEMRERVLRAMREAADGVAPRKPADKIRQQLARAALARERALGWGLREQPARLRVMTFDAMCAGLARQMPLLTGLGSMPEPLEDARPLYREAALETLRAAGDAGTSQEARDARSLLVHSDNRAENAIGLLMEMLAHREQWLRHIGAAGWEPARLRAEIEAGWAREIGRVLAALRAAVPEALADEIIACAAYAGANAADLAVLARLDALPGASVSDLPAWRAMARLILTQDGEGDLRKQVNANMGFPPGKKGSPEAAAKERMKTLLGQLLPAREWLEWLALIPSLPAARFEEKQWEMLAALARLLPNAAARLALLFAERGQADFVEIARRANRALGGPERPTDLALRLDYRIRHLLVDEFQDTSRTQHELLLRLTAGWEPNDGRTLFLVGDPMQSIYRFREAEVRVFLEVERHGLGDLNLEPLRLSSNFRSDPALVGWVNENIASLFSAQPDEILGHVTYTPSVATRDPVAGAGVEIRILRDADEEQEARLVAEVVRSTLKTHPDETIAILVRKRGVLQALLPAFAGAGIHYTGVEIEALGELPVIEDLLSLARALACPGDRLAWLAVLRAPWCGLSLNDLHALAADEPNAPVAELLADDARRARLSAAGRRSLDRVAPVLRAALQERGRDEPVRFLERVWSQLGGPACLGVEACESAQHFFRLYEEHTRAGGTDLRALADALAEQHATPKASDARPVQVITLHKAKGLEFDNVVIPGLQARAANHRERLLRWDEAAKDTLLFAPGPEFGGEDPHYKYLKTREGERELLELRRTIYVGVTRARRKLHLIGSAKTNKYGEAVAPAGSMLRELWDAAAGSVEAVAMPVADRAAVTGQPMLRRLSEAWTPPSVSRMTRAAPVAAVAETVVEFSWAGETARVVGVLVHEQLRRFAGIGLAAWTGEAIARRRGYWLRRLAAEGVPEEAREEAADRIIAALTHTLDDERAQWLFSPEQTGRLSEYAVTFLEDSRPRNLRMDLSFVDREGVRWIVDFKTGTHGGGGVAEFLDRERERYRAQLERYAAAMRALDPRAVRLGLYYPLLKGWREWGDPG